MRPSPAPSFTWQRPWERVRVGSPSRSQYPPPPQPCPTPSSKDRLRVLQPNENGGHSPKADDTPDLLHLGVEVKGYRGEDAKEKKSTMDTYWIPGVNNLGSHGRWAFSEFGDVYEMESDFAANVAGEFDRILAIAIQGSGPAASSPH